MKKIVTADVVAELVGISQHGVHQRIRRGKFPPPDYPAKSFAKSTWKRETIKKWEHQFKGTITIDGIAEWLGVPPHTLYYWRKLSPMPKRLFADGNKDYYSEKEIQQWANDFVEWED